MFYLPKKHNNNFEIKGKFFKFPKFIVEFNFCTIFLSDQLPTS